MASNETHYKGDTAMFIALLIVTALFALIVSAFADPKLGPMLDEVMTELRARRAAKSTKK